jgi:hypothetical protein
MFIGKWKLMYKTKKNSEIERKMYHHAEKEKYR